MQEFLMVAVIVKDYKGNAHLFSASSREEKLGKISPRLKHGRFQNKSIHGRRKTVILPQDNIHKSTFFPYVEKCHMTRTEHIWCTMVNNTFITTGAYVRTPSFIRCTKVASDNLLTRSTFADHFNGTKLKHTSSSETNKNFQGITFCE